MTNPMPIFRDLDGNHYDIPDGELARFLVTGELPAGARLTGQEIPAPPPPPPAPAARHYWRQAEPGAAGYRVVAASEVGSALAGQAYLLVPVEPGESAGDEP